MGSTLPPYGHIRVPEHQYQSLLELKAQWEQEKQLPLSWPNFFSVLQSKLIAFSSVANGGQR